MCIQCHLHVALNFPPEIAPGVQSPSRGGAWIHATGGDRPGSVFAQTKDALFTILHDLRPQDRFSIIGFSNRIKVWKDHLVAVTPDSIRDGKVYIHHMSPTGGKCGSSLHGASA